MYQSQQAGSERGGIAGALPLLIIRALACSLEVFLHKSASFGERYLGAQAAAAVVIMFFSPVFAPRQNPTDLWCFLAVYLVLCGVARTAIFARRRRGELGPHSYYTGSPRAFGRLSERTVKGVIEPAMAWGASMLLTEASPLLAGYLGVAGFALLIKVQLSLAAERRQVIDMHDAYMEQRRTAEEWRAMHRD